MKKKSDLIELCDKALVGNFNSNKRLISYANRLDGLKKLYDSGKLDITDEKAEGLIKAYRHIMSRVSGKGLELNYVTPKQELKLRNKSLLSKGGRGYKSNSFVKIPKLNILCTKVSNGYLPGGKRLKSCLSRIKLVRKLKDDNKIEVTSSEMSFFENTYKLLVGKLK